MDGAAEYNVRAVLLDLASAVRNRVALSLKNGEIQKKSISYTTYVCTGLTWEPHRKGATFGQSTVVRTEWPQKEVRRLWDGTIAPLRELATAKDVIGQAYGQDDWRLRTTYLEHYAWKLMASDDATDMLISKETDALLRNLKDCRTDFAVTVWLCGVQPADEALAIRAGATLRQLTADDLTELLQGYPFGLDTVPHEASILELALRARNHMDARDQVDRIVHTLLLFRLCSAHCEGLALPPFGFSLPSQQRSILREAPRACHYRCTIGTADITALDRFTTKIGPLLPFPRHDQARKVSPISVACEWFTKSVLSSGNVEARIMAATACLEALLMDKEAELSHRLSERAAALLRHAGHNPREVYDNVRSAYDIRSRYVHGSAMDRKQAPSATSLARNLAEYCRLALSIFIQLSATRPKKEIVRILDDSIFEAKALDDLRSIIGNEVVLTQ